MRKAWGETIDSHRREVRDAIMETTAALASKNGLRSVTMSEIAEETGIGRATLYKYFSSVDAILRAWHERQISGHLDYLAEVRDRANDPRERLEAVLHAYALIHRERAEYGQSQRHRQSEHEHPARHNHQHHKGDTELAAFLHQGDQLAGAQQRLHVLIRGLLTEARHAGDVRQDIAPDELTSYCLHALTAASRLPSNAAVQRLVTIILDGLRPPA